MPRAKAKVLPDVMPATYADLIALHPLRPIADSIDLANAIEVANRLAALSKASTDQADFLEVLSTLIESYEDEQERPPAGVLGTADVLVYLIEGAGMSVSDLGRLLGDRAIGAKLLAGKRELSKDHIRTLCERFKVSADLFLR